MLGKYIYIYVEIDRQTKIYRDGVYAILFCHGQATEEELAQSHGQTADGADENDAEGKEGRSYIFHT